MKSVKDIKHGQRVIDSLKGVKFFVSDVQRATGLDEKSLKQVLNQLSRHGHICKNDRGQWFVLESLRDSTL